MSSESAAPKLGRVPSLFPHIQPAWSTNFNAEAYFRSNADVIEDPAITEAECNEILDVPGVRELVSQASQKPKQASNGSAGKRRVLDLCCGQGRHSILLAQKFPEIEFHGHDVKEFLLSMAKSRAVTVGCKNVTFTLGDARHVPVTDEWFDLAFIMGNAFAVLDDDAQHVALLKEVSRVLKPGGILLIDLPSAEHLRSNYSTSGWEWIYGGAINEVGELGDSNGSTDKRMLACRERELAPDGKWLASREIAVDLDKGVFNDLFYRVRLYDLGEMDKMLKQSGMTMERIGGTELIGIAEGHADMGMMANRDLLVAYKTSARVEKQNRLNVNNEPEQGLSDEMIARSVERIGMEVYSHPSIILTSDPRKGKGLAANQFLSAGTTIMSDPGYALVSYGPRLLRFCSRPECSKTVDNGSVSCSVGCYDDVTWCSAACRFLDTPRHNLECTWLSKFGLTILKEEGEYNFSMLLLILRALARRYLELQKGQKPTPIEPGSPTVANHWSSCWSLMSNEEKVPGKMLESWRSLVEKYLQNLVVTANLDVPYLVSLVAREEINSYGLHRYPESSSQFEPRLTYGVGIYLSAARFNHSCEPNVSHEPDDHGRMVFRAVRDIEAGEECCTAYFDLKEHVTVEERRAYLDEIFRFVCTCTKCVRESGKQMYQQI